MRIGGRPRGGLGRLLCRLGGGLLDELLHLRVWIRFEYVLERPRFVIINLQDLLDDLRGRWLFFANVSGRWGAQIIWWLLLLLWWLL